MNSAARHQTAGIFLVWLAFAAAAANAGFYSLLSSGGLVQADGWYFLDTFVRSYLDGTISWRTFLVNRGGSDHIQIIPKLVMLFHLHIFQLDFKVEGLIGWVFAAIGAATLIGVQFRSVPAERRSSAFFLATAATVAVFLSLNSTNVYTWPLATLGFVGLFFFMLSCIAASRAYQEGTGFAALVAATTLLCLTSDKFAILAAASLGGALLLKAEGRKDFVRFAAVMAAVAVPVIAMWFLAHLPGVRGGDPAPVQLARLGNLFLSGLHPWQEVLLIPLSSGLVHDWQLETLPAGWRVPVETGLGLSIALAHIAFWWTVWVRRKSGGLASTVSCAFMLLSYGSTVGIILNRVAEFGPEYVRQPRYVTLDALAIIACLIWFSSIFPRGRIGDAVPAAAANARRDAWGRNALLVASCAIVAIQVPLSIRAWDFVKYVSNYQQIAAAQMGQLAANPARVPPGCVDILVVCNQPVAKRSELMTMLKANGLNIFSRRFQLLWRLYPDEASLPMPAADPGAEAPREVR